MRAPNNAFIRPFPLIFTKAINALFTIWKYIDNNPVEFPHFKAGQCRDLIYIFEKFHICDLMKF